MGLRVRLHGLNAMTWSELIWWVLHEQELVNTLAAANGPDVIGLLHDRTGYGAYGDHGGAQESVQRVPMVFWSPSLAFGNTNRGRFTTPDLMPTVLKLMGIDVTGPIDGRRGGMSWHAANLLDGAGVTPADKRPPSRKGNVMFNITLKRSLATMAVMAGTVVAAGPASASPIYMPIDDLAGAVASPDQTVTPQGIIMSDGRICNPRWGC